MPNLRLFQYILTYSHPFRIRGYRSQSSCDLSDITAGQAYNTLKNNLFSILFVEIYFENKKYKVLPISYLASNFLSHFCFGCEKCGVKGIITEFN